MFLLKYLGVKEAHSSDLVVQGGRICIQIESDFKNGQKWKSLVSLGKEYTGIPCTTLTTYLLEIISTPPKKKVTQK